tara:strand:- start:393 stop:662 length:270 start_codon:yes stop_codon:yes gene_type:complete
MHRKKNEEKKKKKSNEKKTKQKKVQPKFFFFSQSSIGSSFSLFVFPLKNRPLFHLSGASKKKEENLRVITLESNTERTTGRSKKAENLE